MRHGSFFWFSQKIKRKQTYEKDGQYIHIIRITTTFRCQLANALVFFGLIRQHAAIRKTKLKFLLKY